MLVIGYDNTAVRDDLIAVHNRAWERLGSPGTWWPARKRVAIAAEVRRVRDCSLCQRRKEALSPYSIEGEHESSAELPSAVIEVVHRIVSDPGRLTRRWYDGVIGSGLSEAHYVEIVGVIATIVMIDTYARGIGQEPPTLPAAERGDPSNYMPDGVGELGAWVYMIGLKIINHQRATCFRTVPSPTFAHRCPSCPARPVISTTSLIIIMRGGQHRTIFTRRSVR